MTRVWGMMAIGAILSCAAAAPAAAEGPRGLWPLPRKDAQNTARADLAAAMAKAPRGIWRFGGNPNAFSALLPVHINGREGYLALAHGGLRLLWADGEVVWKREGLGVTSVAAVDDFDGDGSPEAVVILGTADVARVDLRDGGVAWTWTAPAGSNVSSAASWKVWRHGGRVCLVVFPQNSLRGIALDLAHRGPAPAVVWDRAYDGAYWQGFGPQIVLADMDRDGVADVVLAGKPGYAAVIDATSGATKFDVHYQVTGGHDEGRPYGLLTATDLDGDGFPDVVMASCQVEEYLSVLHNEGGRGLRPVWSRFLEHDLPEDRLELRPNVTSVADLRGDGVKELVVGLFNVTGDGRWHTVVMDPMKGFEARRADLVDQYFWGCYDLDGDGRPEVITSTEHARKPGEAATMHAYDGRTLREVASVADTALATTGGGPLGADVGFMAIRSTPRFCRTTAGAGGLLLSRREGRTESSIWSIDAAGASRFDAYPITPLASRVALSTGAERVDRLDLTMPKLGEGAVSATGPLVVRAGGQNQLVLALSDGTTLIGEPDLAHAGRFRSSRTFAGSMPACWSSPAGEVTLVTATDDSTLVLYHPDKAGEAPVTIKLPHPLYRNGATRSGPTLLPFGADEMKLFVGLQTGVHTMASALYDADGRRAWADEREGPYPRTAAAARLGPGRGLSLVVDNHGKHLIYDASSGKATLIAHGWNNTIPGRGDGAKYVVPIVGPFGPDGETRILMTAGLQAVETLDAAGKRLAKWDTASTYEFEWNGSAVARLRGSGGGWDLAMVNRDGLLHCFDAATCAVRWTYDLHCKATTPINLVAADLVGDGRDALLIGLPNGNLIAVVERDGRPTPLWSVDVGAGIREAIVGDVDGDGRADVVVETVDGSIRVFTGEQATPGGGAGVRN